MFEVSRIKVSPKSLSGKPTRESLEIRLNRRRGRRLFSDICKRPDVAVVSGLPCCNYCFAAPVEDGHSETGPSFPPPPEPSDDEPLAWPSAVIYGGVKSPPDDECLGGPQAQDGAPASQKKAAVSPVVSSDDEIRLLKLAPSQSLTIRFMFRSSESV
ncbi:hypothetical protein FQN54_007102 [Arachnomyces sp. PD_36]|nr:hypothetical protein FQN54_007102 [Arachnomyces sp. PD_36]